MSHRWLVAVSMSAHLCAAGALFATGVWHLERLQAERLHVELRSPINIPAPSGTVTSQVKVEVPHITHDVTQPSLTTHKPPPEDHPGGASDGEPRGGGGGSGPADSPGTCTENCDPPPPPPVCGDGALDAGEQCDDGNTLDGDGCSAACRIEVKPRPAVATVAPQVLQALRTGGATQVRPREVTQQQMVRDGTTRSIGTLKLCVGPDGGVTSARVLRSTKYADYDRDLLAAVYGWRYQPYSVNGVATSACSTVTFIYQIQ